MKKYYLQAKKCDICNVVLMNYGFKHRIIKN